MKNFFLKIHNFSQIILYFFAIYFFALIFRIAPFSFEDSLFIFLSFSFIYYIFYKYYLKTSPQEQEVEKIKKSVVFNYTVGILPFLFIFFILRAFIFDATVVPSSSMYPTLKEGDYLFLKKYKYGVNLPFSNIQFFSNSPNRFDVALFRFPKDRNQIFVKRVIGLPNDKIVYINKKLFINGVEISKIEAAKSDDGSSLFLENLNAPHKIIDNENIAVIDKLNPGFEENPNCQYDSNAIICIVPENQYFVMGDNRDNSYDSRYWGFVKQEQLYAKAEYVFLNFSNMKNIGKIN